MIREDEDSGAQGLRADTNIYIEEDGRLKENFKQELNELAKDEIKKFTQTMHSKTPVNTDLFGVKRRICELCKEGCLGYEASKYLIPSRD